MERARLVEAEMASGPGAHWRPAGVYLALDAARQRSVLDTSPVANPSMDDPRIWSRPGRCYTCEKKADAMTMYALLLAGLQVATTPPKAEPQAPAKPKDALPMNVDSGRFQKATVVLRVKLQKALGGDKYAWYRVKVLKVLKNNSKQQFGATLDVAALSTRPGVPAQECTIYLEPYNMEKNHPWKLLGGGADQGVSHVAFAGFPVLPPVPNADPSIRRPKEFRLPTRLLVKRTDDQMAVGVDPASLKLVKVEVGANMITGLTHELLVYRGDQLVVSGYAGLQGTGTTYSSIGTVIIQRRIDKVPQPGEKYTVRIRLSLFETDIPVQHMWSPERGKYKVLWTRTLQQEVK
jgi:hypothetical protein